MRPSKTTVMAMTACLSLVSGAALADDAALDLKFAGALEFSDDGTLFVGDNYNGAIYAFDMTGDAAADPIVPVSLGDIDAKIADLVGVGPSAIEINDLVAHPASGEIYISVSRIGNFASVPALIKVTQAGELQIVDLTSLDFKKQALDHYPDQETTFRPRGLGQMPPTARDIAKAEIKLSSMAIMDMAFHKGELFVSGVAYEDFLSTLRRIPVPFDGTQSAASVEMYHIAHDQFETRAPIRAMSIHEIDGKEQLVAAYTCSPLVLIPLDEIEDGAKIAARTIGDMGNGQPIDMVSYTLQDQEMLFVTSNSRSPQVIPVAGLAGTKPVTDKDFERGGKSDLSPVMPYGPIGKTVMFDGVSMQLAALSADHFVSITRDAYTGSLNLDSNPSVFPNRLQHFFAEFDFPQYYEDKAK